MNRIAIYPGSFDPITYGHIDIIERASKMFDKLIVVIAINSRKVSLFSEDERIEMVRASLGHLPQVEVVADHGLVVDFARKVSAIAIIRGIRAISDYEFEFQIALMNRKLYPEANTIFLLPHEKYTYLNSTIVRELSRYDQNIEEFVPKHVADMLKIKFQSKKD
jgi:pantetheine-phosphate adenylyltransferase